MDIKNAEIYSEGEWEVASFQPIGLRGRLRGEQMSSCFPLFERLETNFPS